MVVDFSCPCGGGQSCIVSRRSVNDWVMEDDVFKYLKIPLRKNCLEPFTEQQQEGMGKSRTVGFMDKMNSREKSRTS